VAATEQAANLWRQPPVGAKAGASWVSLHSSPQYLDRFDKALVAAGPRLHCAHCPWSADAAALRLFEGRTPAKPPPTVTDEPTASDMEKAFSAGAADRLLQRQFHLHHRNHNHADFAPDNLELLCCVCHHVQHAAMPGPEESGSLILIAGIDQPDLVNIWRALSVAKSFHPEEKIQGRADAELSGLIDLGKQNFQTAADAPGSWVCSPQHFSNWLHNASAETRDLVRDLFTDLRFLPSGEYFMQHLCFISEFQKDSFLDQPQPAALEAQPEHFGLETLPDDA